jgi:two-component system, response regulator PdtaR
MVENPANIPPVMMIVEDEELVRAVAVEYFLDHGLNVVEAENADKALAMLNCRSDVRLVFTDINMPGSMDGLALAREVNRRWPQMLIVLTSGRGGVPAAKIPEAGEFIAKPYDFESLAERIRTLLKG